MIRLTCLLKRKPGTSHDEFVAHWKTVHAPLVLNSRSGSHVVRYEQHLPAPFDVNRDAYDGITVQWFTSMSDYEAHLAEEDFSDIWADIEQFLDIDHLEFVVTNEETITLVYPPTVEAQRLG